MTLLRQVRQTGWAAEFSEAEVHGIGTVTIGAVVSVRVPAALGGSGSGDAGGTSSILLLQVRVTACTGVGRL